MTVVDTADYAPSIAAAVAAAAAPDAVVAAAAAIVGISELLHLTSTAHSAAANVPAKCTFP